MKTQIRTAGRVTSSVVTSTVKNLLLIMLGVSVLAAFFATFLVILAYSIAR